MRVVCDARCARFPNFVVFVLVFWTEKLFCTSRHIPWSSSCPSPTFRAKNFWGKNFVHLSGDNSGQKKEEFKGKVAPQKETRDDRRRDQNDREQSNLPSPLPRFIVFSFHLSVFIPSARKGQRDRKKRESILKVLLHIVLLSFSKGKNGNVIYLIKKEEVLARRRRRRR